MKFETFSVLIIRLPVLKYKRPKDYVQVLLNREKLFKIFGNTIMTPEYCGRYIRVPTEKSNHKKKRRLVKLLIFFKVFSLFFLPNFIRNNPKLLPNFFIFTLNNLNPIILLFCIDKVLQQDFFSNL
jgi:hypothetical protein